MISPAIVSFDLGVPHLTGGTASSLCKAKQLYGTGLTSKAGFRCESPKRKDEPTTTLLCVSRVSVPPAHVFVLIGPCEGTPIGASTCLTACVFGHRCATLGSPPPNSLSDAAWTTSVLRGEPRCCHLPRGCSNCAALHRATGKILQLHFCSPF